MTTMISLASGVLIAGAGVLATTPGQVARARLVSTAAPGIALAAVAAQLFMVQGAPPVAWLAAALTLVAVLGAALADPALGSRRQPAALLGAAAACLLLADAEGAAQAILGIVVGLGAVAVGAGPRERARLRVFLCQQALACACICAGFALIAEAGPVPASGGFGDMAAVGPLCVLLGVLLGAGLPPFQTGALDVYAAGGEGQVLAFAAAPLPWFTLAALARLGSLGGLGGETAAGGEALVAGVLLAGALLASLGTLATLAPERRAAFLPRARTALLAWALFALVASGGAEHDALLSYAAYLMATVGLLLAERLATARVGSELVASGGLARAMPGLAGFALFFALAAANLPLTANFIEVEQVGELAERFGLALVLATYVGFAALGYAAYAFYTRTFLGPADPYLPDADLDLGKRERAGLACLTVASVATAIWGLWS
jgi:hypothetical protein